jgi:hypothetical protein
MSPPIIEGAKPDPKTCDNCGEQRTPGRLCQNCSYHSGAFIAATPLPRTERRMNPVLRRLYDGMIKAGIMKRSD